MPTLSRVKPKLTFNKDIAGFFIFLHLGALLAFFPFAFSSIVNMVTLKMENVCKSYVIFSVGNV